MKYTCDCLNSLFFDYNCVKCGCSNTGGYRYILPFDGKNFDMAVINSKRYELYRNFTNGIVPDICKNCYMLRETGDDAATLTKELDSIYLSHWYHCNCACIYCSNRDETKLKITSNSQKSQYYDLLPIIKTLTKDGYIGEKTQIFSLGGEPAVLKEYDAILKELAKYTQGIVILLSNGIKFSDTIYEFLKRGNAFLTISLDCGTPEMFRKIKRIDAFDKVINNIRKYNSAVSDDKSSVELKYILIKDLNDNIEELKSFIELSKQTGIRKVYLDVDHNTRNMLKEIPSHWYELFEYFLNVQGVQPNIHDYCRQILDKKIIF